MGNVVHEAEVQRQHARYKLPLKVAFLGKLYDVADWSIGGIGISGVDFALGVGSVHSFRIYFPFDSYELSINVQGEIRYIDGANHRAGVQFVDQDERQINIMRFMVDAMLSGEIVDAGDIIEIASRRMEAPSRSVPKKPAPVTPREKLRAAGGRVLAYGTVGLATVGIIAFVASSAYERLYTIDARSGVVAGDLVMIASPTQGQMALKTTGDTVKRGDPLFDIVERPDSTITVNSPCDCRIVKMAAVDGTYVRPGQNIATLVPTNSRQVVSALVDQQSLMRLYAGAGVHLQYVDGTAIEDSRIVRMPPAIDANGGASNELISVEIDPGRDLAPTAIGQPVAVRFDTFRTSWLGRLFGGGSSPS